MSQAIILLYISITNFILINKLEKDQSMIETGRIKNVVIFLQTILRFMLSRNLIVMKFYHFLAIVLIIKNILV